MFDDTGHCVLPVYSLPKDQITEVKDRNTWYIGRVLFERYFVVYDGDTRYERYQNDTLVTSEGNYNNTNFIGISACNSYKDSKGKSRHIPIFEDNDGKPYEKKWFILLILFGGPIMIVFVVYCCV